MKFVTVQIFPSSSYLLSLRCKCFSSDTRVHDGSKTTILRFLSAKAVTLLTCNQEVTGSKFGRNTDYSEVLRGFPLSLWANTRIVPWITPQAPSSLSLPLHPTIRRYTVSATDSVVKQTANKSTVRQIGINLQTILTDRHDNSISPLPWRQD
jgi:hypothetical protein